MLILLRAVVTNKSIDLSRSFRFPVFMREKFFYVSRGSQEQKISFTRENSKGVKSPCSCVKGMGKMNRIK